MMWFSKKDEEKLKAALEVYVERESAALPSEEALAKVTFSPEFERKMEKRIAAQSKPRRKLFNTWPKRVATIALAVLIGTTVAVTGVSSFREPEFKMIYETFDTYTEIRYENASTESFEHIPVEPAYIPEGFVCIKSELIPEGFIYKNQYQNANDEPMLYEQFVNSGASLWINTEDAEFYQEISIQGLPGFTYKSSKCKLSYVVFANKQYIFQVSIPDTLPYEEVIKIAESVPIPPIE